MSDIGTDIDRDTGMSAMCQKADNQAAIAVKGTLRIGGGNEAARFHQASR
jgi:hypothetical protein